MAATLPRCFDWLALVRVSKSVFALVRIRSLFSYDEIIMWERLSHFRFDVFDIRKSVFFFFFFYVEDSV